MCQLLHQDAFRSRCQACRLTCNVQSSCGHGSTAASGRTPKSARDTSRDTLELILRESVLAELNAEWKCVVPNGAALLFMQAESHHACKANIYSIWRYH